MLYIQNVPFRGEKDTPKKNVNDGRLQDKSHIVPKGVLTLPKNNPGIEEKLPLDQIPAFALLSRVKFIDKSKRVESSLKAKDIKRAVMINEADFLTFKTPSLRHITGVHPNVPLRTDDFIVTDTKIDPIVPDLTGDLIFPDDTLEFDQVNALYHAEETKNMINNYWGIDVPWAFDSPIKLNAHARFFNGSTGEYVETWDNAFYSRSSKEIALLIGENKREKDSYVFAARSADTIAHETSHAKLDGLENYYGDSKCFITVGIHEAFADFNAMLRDLHSNRIVDRLLEETKGDLRKDNIVSMFDIQFGRQILSKEQPCLRSAINSYKRPDNISDLKFIPSKMDGLGIEPHIYSQLLVGALYDSFVALYENNLTTYNNQKMSLIKAKDTIGKIFNRSFLCLPAAEVNFKDVAKAMLIIDKLEFGGKNSNILIDVFKARNILNDDDIANHKEQQARIIPFNLPDEELIAPHYEALLDEHKNDLGISKDKKFKFHKKFVDQNGNTFIKYTHDHILEIPKIHDKYFSLSGDKIDIKDGVTLVFNKERVLSAVMAKEISAKDKTELLTLFERYADYRYRPLQEGYDELGDEWEAELKRREEEKRKKAKEAKEDPDKPKPPKSTIHRYNI
ncbi:MAG: hypothetical protein AB1782_03375 [Cyanobacteriota bacterium]